MISYLRTLAFAPSTAETRTVPQSGDRVSDIMAARQRSQVAAEKRANGRSSRLEPSVSAVAKVPQQSAALDSPLAEDLQRIPLFSALSVSECLRIAQSMQECHFKPGELLVSQGKPAPGMFVITAGLVEVRKKDSASGAEFVLFELGPWGNFGEMSLLRGSVLNASVYAAEPTACVLLDHQQFRDLLKHDRELAVGLVSALAGRLERAEGHPGIESIDLTRMHVNPLVLRLLPRKIMLEHRIIPISFRSGRLVLAMTNPNNILAWDDVRRVIKGVLIEPVLVTERDFRRFMNTTYRSAVVSEEPAVASKPGADAGEFTHAFVGDSTEAALEALLQSDIIRDLELAEDPEPDAESKQDLMNASGEAPIIRLANFLLGLAIKRDSSDIHIEPMENAVTIRFRIDGELQVVQELPKKIQLGLVSRFKILSKLDISEKRLPQDGRFTVFMEGRPIDIRVATLPSRWGEKICLRILDKSGTMLGLDKLISHGPTRQRIRDLIHQPHGIVYVTGPTGSGKTTTLYSALTEINRPGVNILTVEDPIEYDLPGVSQVQINREIGLDFAHILRSLLRQDPNIMFVGETRDEETAQISVEAALTGHLVFTTLHTNSAAGCFARLMEMGVEPFLLASSTAGIVAQRLVRRLCEACKRPYAADESTCAYLGLPRDSVIYEAVGCTACGGQGLKGRVGVYEVLTMNQDLRSLVAKRASTAKVHASALAQGMIDLKQYAALLLLEGNTTVEQVLPLVKVHA